VLTPLNSLLAPCLSGAGLREWRERRALRASQCQQNKHFRPKARPESHVLLPTSARVPSSVLPCTRRHPLQIIQAPLQCAHARAQRVRAHAHTASVHMHTPRPCTCTRACVHMHMHAVTIPEMPPPARHPASACSPPCLRLLATLPPHARHPASTCSARSRHDLGILIARWPPWPRQSAAAEAPPSPGPRP